MATKTDYEPLAVEVLKHLGGPDNVYSVTHCATRLRFKINDDALVDDAAVKKVPGVLTLVKAGGQHQVVVGNDVPLAYQAIVAQAGMARKGVKDNDSEQDGAESNADNAAEGKKSPVNAFIDMISALFTPVIWCLAGLGLGKAFLTLFTNFNLLSAESDTYVVFNAAFDAFFYFLPLFLAATAARYFKMNQFIAMATVAPLVYPSIVELAQRDDVHLFGIPLMTATYTSSVLAPVIALWIASYLQRWLEKVLPGSLRNFFTPLIVVGVMVPLVLLTVGPATAWLSQLIADGVSSLFGNVPWLGGALMGGLWQVFVIFGLHWAFVPILLNEFAVDGRSFMMAVLMAAVLAQAAAALAVFLRTRDAGRKKVAGAGIFSGFLAGVTEPIIYGVNLPLKLPFYAGCVGGAVGGAIIAMGGNAFDSYVFPSLLALPAAMSIGSFASQLIGSGTAIAIGFVGSWLLVPRAERAEQGEQGEATAEAPAPVPAATEESEDENNIVSPVPGTVVELGKVPDEVFASGAMGKGLGVKPSSGEVVSPVSGTIIAVPKSGHAFGIKTDGGVEVLVHVGVDTVRMKGEGFAPHVKKGDTITAGQPLVSVDLQKVAEAGYDDTTVLLVTNADKLSDVTIIAEDGQAVTNEVLITTTK